MPIGTGGANSQLSNPTTSKNASSGGFDIMGVLGDMFGGLSTGGWGAVAGGLLGGFASLGGNKKQDQYQQVFDNLQDSEDYIKSTPFSKDEIMNQLLPQAQKIYRGSADVLAGKAGSAVGESGVAKGQSFSEYYTQALSPIIAEGEKNAGDAIGKFGKWYSDLDAQGKNRFLDSIRMQLGALQGTDGMSDLQKFTTGGVPMASMGANIGGELDIIKELTKRLGLDQGLADSTSNFGNVNKGGG